MRTAEDFTYQVSWSEDDGEYLATVKEFVYLSYLDSSRTRALDGMKSVVEAVLELHKETNRETLIPQ